MHEQEQPLTSEELGQRLRTARERKHFTQEYVAQQFGFDPTIISKIESGKRSLDTFELRKFALLYNLSIHRLLDDAREAHMLGEARILDEETASPRAHVHDDFTVAASATVVVRMCTTCGMTWTLDYDHRLHCFSTAWYEVREPAVPLSDVEPMTYEGM